MLSGDGTEGQRTVRWPESRRPAAALDVESSGVSQVTNTEEANGATKTAGTVADASWPQTRAILRLIIIALTFPVLWVLERRG